MKSEIKEAKYPENLPLAVEVFKSGMTQEELADKIGCSRQTLNQTINGHYKGVNIVPKIKEELGLQ